MQHSFPAKQDEELQGIRIILGACDSLSNLIAHTILPCAPEQHTTLSFSFPDTYRTEDIPISLRQPTSIRDTTPAVTEMVSPPMGYLKESSKAGGSQCMFDALRVGQI